MSNKFVILSQLCYTICVKRFSTLKDAYPVCEAIASPVRLEILEQLMMHRALNLVSLAHNLHLTSGALTKHIKMLEDAGLVRVKSVSGKRGNQKLCSLAENRILIDLAHNLDELTSGFAHDLNIGLYSDYMIQGLCGLVGSDGFIGRRDEKSSFALPARGNAKALWLQKGYISYLLPPVTLGDSDKILKEIQISLEVSPDLTGNGIPNSILEFMLDDKHLGKIKLYNPDEKRRGFLTPTWYSSTLPQFGTLKLLRITQKGTFVDGEKISDITPQNLNSAKKFSMVTDTGIMLFGHNFGDYNQGIRFNVEFYEKTEDMPNENIARLI